MSVMSTSPGVLLPFINELEKKLNTIIPIIQEWDVQKEGLYKLKDDMKSVQYKSTSALSQSSSASAEITNATMDVQATTPSKLETLISNLRKEMLALTGRNETGNVLLNTFTVEDIQERDSLEVVLDGAICLVRNASADKYAGKGFGVYARSNSNWLRISDQSTAKVKEGVTSLESRVDELENGLSIYEGEEEPDNKRVLWIN